MTNNLFLHRRSGFTIFVTLLLATMALALVFLLYRHYSAHFRRLRAFDEVDKRIEASVKLGDEREKVIQAMLDAGAWYHVKCGEVEQESITDYFYFGDKDIDKVVAFIMKSKYENGRYYLEFIATNRDTSSPLDSGDCLPPELKDERTRSEMYS